MFSDNNEGQTLAIDAPPAKKRVPNALTQAEKHRLIEGGPGHAGVIGTCKAAARQHQRYMLTLGRHTDFEDLESVAYIACVEAANYWSAEGGASFNTYASKWISTRLREFTDNRHEPPRPGYLSSPELVVSRDNGGGDDEKGRPARKPTDEQWILLNSLHEKTRYIILAVVFDGRTPAQVADDLGRKVKDILLIIRNAVAKMGGILDSEELSIFADCPTEYVHGGES